ncbi:MAG: hypothetical protein PHU85_14780, partial [Phycisphaerae bacterium]|nr:hypothetical protein [Phycisphaerae bacterium]
MTVTGGKREQYLAALVNKPFDRLTWAPNFDYWLQVNKANGTVPPAYRDMSRNDIVRAVGGTIWSRVKTVTSHMPGIGVQTTGLGQGRWRHVYHTPAGDLTTLHVTASGEDHAVFLEEHLVKTAEDLPALLAMIRATRFKVNAEPAARELAAVGEDGITLEPCPCVPFIQFGKTDAGWEAGLLMWYDHRAKVEEVLDAWTDVSLEEIRLTAQHSPAPMITLGDNMDQLMVSPDLFRRYALPFYER